MNCKPGDMAIVVRHLSDAPRLLGSILKCIEVSQWGAYHVWRTDPVVVDKWGRERLVGDRVLRPTHDPGDDAQDETLSWLPVPSKTLEQA